MTSTTYEIVVRGRATARFLRPLLDDFAIDHSVGGVTRLTGEVRDAAHLHGIVAHLSSINTELISIGPRTPPTSRTTAEPRTTPTSRTTAEPRTTPTSRTTAEPPATNEASNHP